jgi:hypothetical protein
MVIVGCPTKDESSEPVTTNTGQDCSESEIAEQKLAFASDIWPIFSTSCLSCHQNPDSKFPLVSTSEFGAGDTNFYRIKRYGKALLAYATNSNGSHEGGEILNNTNDSQQIFLISKFMNKLQECTDNTVIGTP